jgi:hypothetical protein
VARAEPRGAKPREGRSRMGRAVRRANTRARVLRVIDPTVHHPR